MFPWLWLVHHCWLEVLDLISYRLTNLQKKLLGSAKMATFSLVVLSLFLIRSKELWDPVNWHVPSRWLHGISCWQCNTSDYVTHLSAVMMAMVSSVVMMTGPHGWGLSSRFSLLNSTVNFFTMSRWDHHVFLDLLECWHLVIKVVDDLTMAHIVHFIGNHWCTMIYP